MIEILKKQLKIQREDWLTGLVVVLAGTLLGEAVLQCVMRFAGKQETYIALGTAFAGMLAIMYSVIMTLSMFGVYFNIEVSMGCTRKKFFVSFFGVNFLWNLVYVGVLCLICLAENRLCRVWFPGSRNELDFLPYGIKWGIPLAFFLPMGIGLCGAMVLRFGSRARGILLAIWLVVCIGGPRVSEAVKDAPDSVFGRVGEGIIRIARLLPGDIWMILAGAGSLICFGAAYMIMRKQQVTL